MNNISDSLNYTTYDEMTVKPITQRALHMLVINGHLLTKNSYT